MSNFKPNKDVRFWALRERFNNIEISGYIFDADVGSIAYGYIEDEENIGEYIFSKFVCVDAKPNSLKLDIVQVYGGKFYVIANYLETAGVGIESPHIRKLSLLQEHIRVNPEYYQTLRRYKDE